MLEWFSKPLYNFFTSDANEKIKYRHLNIWRRTILNIWLVSFISFHFYTVITGQLPKIQQGAIHLGFVMAAIYWIFPLTGRMKNPNLLQEILFHIIPALGSILVNGYIALYFREITNRGAIPTSLEYFLGILAFILIFEAGRRIVGNMLTGLALFFLFYTGYGTIFPGFLKHAPKSLMRIIQHFYLTTEGIYGIAIYVSSTFVILFVVFGAFIAVGGASDLFKNLGVALAGKSSGGPAKVAILSSGLLGTINGSSIANVATTGTFTIPLMKKIGYKPEFAAGVEAVASTGGQILPPIMGAAAFIMAQFLGVSYTRVILAAIVPAILYYYSLFVNVHIEAKKLGLEGLPDKDIPKLSEVLKENGHLLVPIFVIIAFLVRGYSAVFAAFYGIVSAVLISFIKKDDKRMNLAKILTSMRNGGETALSIASACSLVGFIIGSTSLTGLAMMLSNNIIKLANGELINTLILAMLSCLLLGMALPTTANYVVTSTLIAPALFKLGVPLLVSHLFCFQYGITADITPPVCMASYTGAGIANADTNKTGILGARLGIAAYLIPLMFVKYQVLLMIDFELTTFIIALARCLLGLLLINVAFERWFITRLNNIEFILFFISGILILFIDIYNLHLLGFLIFLGVSTTQYRRSKIFNVIKPEELLEKE